MSSSFAGSNAGLEPDQRPKSAISLDLEPQQVAELFPFHLVFDEKMRATQIGPSLAKLFPELRLGMDLRESWTLERPSMPFSFEDVLKETKSLFLVRASKAVRLRGQMVPMTGMTRIAFLCSPWLPEPGSLTATGLTFEDFPLHDSMPEFVHVVQTQRLGMEDLRKLSGKLRQQREALKEANRKQQEQSAESQKLALIAARTDNGVIVTDARGVTEWVNEAFCRITGYSSNELCGKPPGELLQGPETDPETIAYISSQLRRRQGFSCEILNYRRSGSKYWVAIEVQPIHDEQGRLMNYMAIERDITALKAEESRKQLAYAVSTILANSSDSSEVLNRIVQTIVESVGCLFSVIWQLDRETDTLQPSKVWSVPFLRGSFFEVATRRLSLRRGEGLPGVVLETNEAFWISDLAEATNFVRKEPAARDSLRSGFGFPIRVAGEPRGVMEFYSARTQARDGELLATLGALGTQIGQFMERQDNEAERGRLVSLLHSTLESTTDGVLVVDQDGKFVVWNQRFLSIFAFSGELLAQAGRSAVAAQAAALLSNPDDFWRRVDWWYQHPEESGDDVIHFRDGRVFERTTQPQRAGGSVIGRVWSYRDITERWRTAEGLRESEERYRVITSTASDGILSIDSQNQILFANRAAERMFGYSPGSLAGKPLREIMPSTYKRLGPRELIRIVRGATTKDTPKPAQIEGLRADGSEFPIEITFGTSHLRGERVLTGVIRDITERRATEEKLEAAMLTLKLANMVAETANQAKSDFLASISHEIGTPLNSIAGLTELLRGTPLDKQQRDMVETVWTGSESLLHLINDLLDFSKIEAGQVDIVTEEFDPLQTGERALELVKAKAQRKGLALVCFTNSPPMPRVEGDGNRVAQILVNLLSNGVKFTETGSVVLRLEWKPLDQEQISVEFSVIDTGIGISEEERARVFDKFYRADTQVGRRAGGTGLGLSISRLLAEAMGGTLEVFPGESGRGSRFLLRLPLPVIGLAPRTADEPVVHAGLLASPERRDLLAQALSGVGWQLAEASESTGVIVREAGVGVDGLPPRPVIVIGPPQGGATEGLNGAEDVIDFPLTPTKLKAALSRALGRAPKETSSAQAAPPAIVQIAPLPLAPASVLLVEDYPESAFYAKLVLEKAGHHVTVAATAKEAVEAAFHGAFDIIFMDLLLPDGSGLDAGKAIREQARAAGLPKTPMIALTAHAIQDYRQLAYRAEMDDYLAKPIRPETLLSAVSTWAKPRNAGTDISRPVPVPVDLADLVPGFIERTCTKLRQIPELMTISAFDEVARVGHNLKGSGSTYGFDEVTRRGREIESAARNCNPAAVQQAVDQLLAYLKDVRWQAQPRPSAV